MAAADGGGACSDHAAPRVYIASPIFTPAQLAGVEDVVNVVHAAGYVSYSPARDGVMLAPSDPPDKRDEVFFSNTMAIQGSDLLIAILDVKDTGTIWELGAATGRGLPIVAITLDVPRMNVMLERGVVAHVRTLDDLAQVLAELRPHLTYGRKATNGLRAQLQHVLRRFKQTYQYSGETQ